MLNYMQVLSPAQSDEIFDKNVREIIDRLLALQMAAKAKRLPNGYSDLRAHEVVTGLLAQFDILMRAHYAGVAQR